MQSVEYSANAGQAMRSGNGCHVHSLVIDLLAKSICRSVRCGVALGRCGGMHGLGNGSNAPPLPRR